MYVDVTFSVRNCSMHCKRLPRLPNRFNYNGQTKNVFCISAVKSRGVTPHIYKINFRSYVHSFLCAIECWWNGINYSHSSVPTCVHIIPAVKRKGVTPHTYIQYATILRKAPVPRLLTSQENILRKSAHERNRKSGC